MGDNGCPMGPVVRIETRFCDVVHRLDAEMAFQPVEPARQFAEFVPRRLVHSREDQRTGEGKKCVTEVGRGIGIHRV